MPKNQIPDVTPERTRANQTGVFEFWNLQILPDCTIFEFHLEGLGARVVTDTGEHFQASRKKRTSCPITLEISGLVNRASLMISSMLDHNVIGMVPLEAF